MKVNDLARLTGIAGSKIRYYDRMGLIQGARCESNNYRDYNELDALNIYHARMLRSFDMSVQESIEAKGYQLPIIDQWVEDHIEDLERNIRFEQLRIQRLKEMKNYFQLMQRKERFQEVELHNMSYNIWHIGKHIQMDAPMQKTVEILADAMPFSYVAIRISIASILSCQEELDVCIGLGILEKNKELLGLEFPMPLEERSRRHVLQFVIETQDPFHLKRSEIQPLLDECEKRGIPLQRDLIGRIYISYQKKELFVHGVGIGIEIANKN